MAFQIIPGTATTPDQYIGTPDVDTANIQSITSSLNKVELTGLGSDDVVVLQVDPTDSTFSLGDGNDIFTGNVLGGATLVGGFVNGNRGRDTIGNPQFGFNATIARIQGGQDGDTIYSSNLQNSIVNGNNGDDRVFSGPGTDVVGAFVNVANSSIFGGQGDDEVRATAGSGSGYFNSVIGGNLGNDDIFIALTGTAIFQGSRVEGNEGDDLIDASASTINGLVLDGGDGVDDVRGGQGNDRIFGGSGEDFLFGGQGRDIIDGGTDDDQIEGGQGADTLTGGTGSNLFIQFAGATASVGTYIGFTNGAGFRTYDFANGDFTDRGGVNGDGILNGGDTFVLDSGFDVITDWNTGAGTNKIDTNSVGLALGNSFVPTDLSWGYYTGANSTPALPGALGTTTNFAVRGFFSQATNSFEVGTSAASGPDILVFTATIQNTLQASVQSISNYTVLQGAGGSNITAATFI